MEPIFIDMKIVSKCEGPLKPQNICEATFDDLHWPILQDICGVVSQQ